MRIISFLERAIISAGFLFLVSFVLAQRQRSVVDCVEYARQALCANAGHIHAAFFVPDDPVKMIMLGLINNEQQSIRAAQFRLIDKDIAQALIDANQLRNVTVEFITDHTCLMDQHEKISWLVDYNIPVHKYINGSTLMHNKFWLFGKNFLNKRILVTGSANATRSGLTRNQENIIVLEEKAIIDRYQAKFTKLFNQTMPVLKQGKEQEPIFSKSVRQLNQHLRKVIRFIY